MSADSCIMIRSHTKGTFGVYVCVCVCLCVIIVFHDKKYVWQHLALCQHGSILIHSSFMSLIQSGFCYFGDFLLSVAVMTV